MDYLVGGSNCDRAEFQHQHQQQRKQTQKQPMGTSVTSNATQMQVGVPLVPRFLERQRLEEHRFILQQAENMRVGLGILRKKQTATMMRLLETKTTTLLKKKEEEMESVAKRSMELEEYARRAEMEVQKWQTVARENEAVAMDLSQRLEQVQNNNNHCCYNNGDNSCSCSCSAALPVMEEEEEGGNGGGGQEGRRYCRCCFSRDASVLFLPCRHLATCRNCAELFLTCPVCSTPKQASFEVFLP